MTKDEVIKLMTSSKSEKQWNENCDKVKAAHKGGYPSYWYETFIVSGVIAAMQKSWKLREV